MKKELLECPLCGSSAILTKLGNEYHAMCDNNDCHTVGPFSTSKDTAVKKWNTRTAHNSDYAKCKEAYMDGYEAGHNDTVESCYGFIEEKADEWVRDNFTKPHNINQETK